jgi:hypothetical protein
MSVVHVYLPDVRALPVTDVKALRAHDISAVCVYRSEGSVVHVFHTGVSYVYVNLNDLNIVQGLLTRVSIGITCIP